MSSLTHLQRRQIPPAPKPSRLKIDNSKFNALSPVISYRIAYPATKRRRVKGQVGLKLLISFHGNQAMFTSVWVASPVHHLRGNTSFGDGPLREGQYMTILLWRHSRNSVTSSLCIFLSHLISICLQCSDSQHGRFLFFILNLFSYNTA